MQQPQSWQAAPQGQAARDWLDSLLDPQRRHYVRDGTYDSGERITHLREHGYDHGRQDHGRRHSYEEESTGRTGACTKGHCGSDEELC